MKIKKITAILLALSLVIVYPAFAKNKGNKPDKLGNEILETENEESISEEVNEANWKTEKESLKGNRNELKSLRKQTENEIKDLEKEIKEAEKTGDTTVVESLKEEFEALTTERNNYITEIHQIAEEIKQSVREKYTAEELEKINEAGESLDEIEDVEVIPVENILVKNRDVKFDTPPVIKQGRTLIPVRAITESMGATVEWNGDEQLVTITKDDKVIVFDLNNDKVFIDGEETAIDVSSEVMNNRTMVPLRFIAENFGLKVDYDEDTEIIEIGDDEDTTDPEEEVTETDEDTTDPEEQTNETDEETAENTEETDENTEETEVNPEETATQDDTTDTVDTTEQVQ